MNWKGIFRMRLLALCCLLMMGIVFTSTQNACTCDGNNPGLEGSENPDGGGEKIIDSVCPKPGDACQDNTTCQACGNLMTCLEGSCVDTGEPFDLDSIPFCPNIGSSCNNVYDCQKDNCPQLNCTNGICQDVIPDIPPDELTCPFTCNNPQDCNIPPCGQRIACVRGVCSPPEALCPERCENDRSCQNPNCGERVRCVEGRCGTIPACPERCAEDSDCLRANCEKRTSCRAGTCIEPGTNTPPVAVILPIKDAPEVGNRITLDGRDSSDADGDPLTFRWRITRRPQGSQAAFDNNTLPTPAFVPDAVGIFTIELVVNDGQLDSVPATLDLDIKREALPPPVLSRLLPDTLSKAQIPTDIRVFGSNLDPQTKLTLNGNGVVSVFINASEMTFRAENLAVGTYKIQAFNPDGQQSNELELKITDGPPVPVITSIDPPQASESTTFTLKVFGSGFDQGATIELNGQRVTTTVNSDRELQASIGPLMIGSYTLQVTNSDGQKSNTVTLQIAAQQITLTSITPATFVAGQATSVRIVGNNFQNGAVLVIAGQNITTAFQSGTALSAVVTLNSPGSFTAFIRNPSGSISNSITITVTVAPPKLDFISPDRAQELTPLTLRVVGAGFAQGATVSLNAQSFPATFVSATELRVSLPALAAGSYNVTVLNPDNQRSNAVVLTLTPRPPAPTITSVLPARVEQGSGTIIEVNGANYVQGAQIQIGPRLLNATFVSATKLSVAVPTDLVAGNYPVVVFNPDNQRSNTATIEIFRLPAPTLTSINPTQAEAGTALTIELVGTNFRNTSRAIFQGGAQTTTYVNDQNLRMTLSLNGVAAGTYEIWVQNPDGQISQKLPFTVTAPQGPQINQLIPRTGSINTTVNGLVDGTGFVTGAKVLFNGQAITTTFINGSSLGVVYNLQGVAPGTYPVLVENPDGSTSNSAFFTVSATQLPAPILTSVTPTTIRLGSSDPIYLNGQHFQSGAVMSLQLPFVGVVGLPTNFINSTLLIVTSQLPSIPFPFPPQRVNVFITNPDGQRSNSLQVTVQP